MNFGSFGPFLASAGLGTTHPSFKVALLKSRLPLKVERGQIFECWQFWAFFGLGRPRDQGGSLLRTRFTPSALVQRSADPNRTIFGQWLTYVGGRGSEACMFPRFFGSGTGKEPCGRGLQSCVALPSCLGNPANRTGLPAPGARGRGHGAGGWISQII